VKAGALIFAFAALATAQEQSAHFHHVHLNSTDPAAAAEFYAKRFASEKTSFADGSPAVWVQKSWLLFHKVPAQPPHAKISAIWHIGWGAEDMKAEYQRQLDLGTSFDTPITELFPNWYYSYVEGPDKVLIEVNTANHRNFGHLHLLAADPVASAEWYMKHFGIPTRSGRPLSRQPVTLRGVNVGAAASLQMDNVNIILFERSYAKCQYKEDWQGREDFVSTRGRNIDHIAFSVADLDMTLKRLAAGGVRVETEPHLIPGTKMRSAFVEGPDKIVLELVEGHAVKP
jgi:catechol 2,3-dioxygenase-like lactoylglutathione lyase family enzyme